MDTKDELTGLLDRASFLVKLDELHAQAVQKHTHLTLVAIDIDHLKPFNDTYGHAVGDEMISLVAKFVGDAFGDLGPVGRYGGDEFLAAVVGQPTDQLFERAESARKKVESARISLASQPAQNLPAQVSRTIVLGLATYPYDAIDTNDLIDKAKQAMYRAKENGGNLTCLYEEKDAMTGLYNHFGILRRLDEACVRAAQKNQTFSILLIDLDEFDRLNTQYGHRAGDEVLRRMASILQANFRDENILGRFAGDEFIVIMPDCRAESAFVLAEEVRKLVEDTRLAYSVAGQDQPIQFHISGGIATFPADASDRIDLLRKADEATYRAKRSTRNRICLPTSSQMVTKTSHFTQTQLERLAILAKQLDKSEAFLLREGLDDLLRKYDELQRQGY